MFSNNKKIISLIVLAKSAKKRGYCVAGIDIINKNFVRLVKDKEGNSIDRNSFSCKGVSIETFDLIDIAVEDAPLLVQVENKVLKEILSIKKRVSTQELMNIIKDIKNGNLLHSTTGKIAKLDSNNNGSLMIIPVRNLKTKIFTYLNGRPNTKASFQYNGKTFYNFSVTDFDYFQKDACIENSLLIISLPEKKFEDDFYHYFIAKIIPIQNI